MKKNILNDQGGAVLVLVLIVLVAAIIMGVMSIRTAVVESRIAGNDQRYITGFNNLESGVNLFTIMNTAGLAALGVDTTGIHNFSHPSLPATTHVVASLKHIGKPPRGRGYDPSLRCRQYMIDATEDVTSQRVQAGVWKIFPPSQ